eukprot:TRINITY_DN4444_c0_g1_i1.p4 TRINITY_DN4444_c0_g1~~TRINITY_DN4444_c0_g1_i1.p4  ORF type:complete len:165 (-),score=21.24 TRINITY_DN4444_c0_g1_i1:25-519(-)
MLTSVSRNGINPYLNLMHLTNFIYATMSVQNKNKFMEINSKVVAKEAEEVTTLKDLLQSREKQLVGMVRELADITYRIQQVIIGIQLQSQNELAKYDIQQYLEVKTKKLQEYDAKLLKEAEDKAVMFQQLQALEKEYEKINGSQLQQQTILVNMHYQCNDNDWE